MNTLGSYSHVHFIGIGGISMRQLALSLKQKGLRVSGSDHSIAEDVKNHLTKSGIEVFSVHDKQNITGADLIVKNSAIKADNCELKHALDDGIDIIERAELLGLLMREHKNSVAISGMHGKTTTTALVSGVLSPLSPTVHIGGELVKPVDASKSSDLFVTEACEYCRNFLSLSPTVEVILNIDEDHLDYYKDLADIKLAFSEFAGKLRHGGALVINGDDKNCAGIFAEHKITFGMREENDYYASNLTEKNGRYSFDVYKNNKYLIRLHLPVLGKHNVYNALAAFIVGQLFDLPSSVIKERLENFSGVKRRWEILPFAINGAAVISDYAHHPKEILALLKSAREAVRDAKIFCVFEPHTYSRTAALFDDFCACFDAADTVVLAPVYAARETQKDGKTSKELFAHITNKNKIFLHTPTEIITYLKQNVTPSDLVLIVGAGTLVEVVTRHSRIL